MIRDATNRASRSPPEGDAMCHDSTAQPPFPPFPPIAGGAGAKGHDLELIAADGNRFAAFSAITDQPGGPGIVILPDVRGLHPFYTELALRFAEAGIHGTALDYFGRTAGIGPRDDAFEYMPHVMRTEPDTIAADTAAAVAHLRSAEGGSAGSVFTVGFCFGGRNSFNQAVRHHGLAGVIGFYGRVGERDPGDAQAPVHLADAYACPVLGLFGGTDGGIPWEDVEGFRQALDAAGVANEIVTYDGAPHSFFDRSSDQHREACDDAWRRMLAFVKRNP
jgi:carboxymethylenebutenolidase